MELWQWHCRNRMGKKLHLVCGNAIAEIGGKKIFFWQLWQFHCRKWEGKKKVVSEIWGGIKKKCYVHNIFTTFLQ